MGVGHRPARLGDLQHRLSTQSTLADPSEGADVCDPTDRGAEQIRRRARLLCEQAVLARARARAMRAEDTERRRRMREMLRSLAERSGRD